METTTTHNKATAAVFVKMATDAWHTHNARVEKLIDSLTDAQLEAETAPGRNTGKYLYGHLIAVSDRLFDAMGWGGRLHPEMDEVFLASPDKSGHKMPSIAELKQYWRDVNDKLNGHIAAMQPEEWFSAHSTVSAEDFVKEPHRNKLNLLISRASHTGYHLGQMAYLAEKK